ncbi:SMP-30/gluconolactonase/LRE family protein [Solirubrobacter sp. CPCC 204708]|uniref:NHL repeat-containing protein n=1 Tax=Solirubrobacter deserti TaxID=2282478 RepID=A0ABT4RHD0_9ACTN|nr:NHL repeat-containing protein [Solirubrobacter deserti]MBE2315195.1 SMP-30/gluconolactonase/LRE family protein [Solirubrobacter deserti]MDA0137878.1 NHL repeat-containing protein [Solirubrobacter deserti]
MPRLVIVLLAALFALPATPATAAEPCLGADPCPYSASSVVGNRTGGVLRFPQATAVGPDGSVYVADQYSHAIQVFGPDGRFVREIGDPERLTSVGGVAIGPDNSIYVADGRDRIDRFAADGTFLAEWGRTGDGVGEFRFGQGGGNDSGAGGGLAIADGYLFVADTRNDRIQRFALDGTGATVIVPKGAVKRPQGLAARGGRLIVADDNGHRMVVYDYNGAQLTTFGSGPGPRPGQLSFPYDVGIDALGRVFVADNINHRVVRYGPAPGYVYRGRWGSYGSRLGQLQYPRGLAVAPNGDQFVADPGGNRIDVFDFQGKPKDFFGDSGRVTGQFIRPLGVASDVSGMRAVADSVNGRVQLLDPSGKVVAAFGAPAPGPTLLPDPVSVAFDGRGLLYVLDQRRSRVLVFDRGGKIVREIGSRGRRAGQLLSPSAIAVSGGGTVYVADTGNGRIVRFSTAGQHIGSVGRFRNVRGVAVSPDGSRIYATDAGTNRITIMTASGGDVGEIGVGELRSPAEVALDAAGNVFVADRGNHRVAFYSPDGQPLGAWGSRGTGPGQLWEPTGISVSCNGLVTVSEADNNRVQQFQLPATGGCGSLPAITPPPNPILATQPDPVPPEVFLEPTRTSGILGIRQFPLRVRCDVRCRLTAVVTLTPRGKKSPAVKLAFTPQTLPAGNTVTIRPRLSVAGVRSLARALKGKRALTATVQVTASTEDSSPTTVTRRVSISG